jgi:hypothetical protein
MTLQTFGAKNLKLQCRARRDAPALMASHSQAQETQQGMENRMLPFMGKSGITRMLLEIRANLGSSCFVSDIMNANPKRSKKTEKPKPKKQDDDVSNNHNSPSRPLRERELSKSIKPLSLSLSPKNKSKSSVAKMPGNNGVVDPKCAVFRLVPQFVYSSPVKLVNKMFFSSFCSRMSPFNPAKIFSKMLDFSYFLKICQFASIQILQQNV